MKEWSDSKKSFYKIKNHLFFIVLLIGFSLIITGLMTLYFVPPVYEASTSVIIHQKALEENQLTRDELRGNVHFISTYREILSSPHLLGQVVEEFNLNLTTDQLQEQIAITPQGESQVVSIAVSDGNPETAVLIANKLVELSKSEIQQLISLDNVIVLATATKGEPVSGGMESLVINLAFAAMGALICGSGISFFVEYFDRTIKDESDILEALDLPVLGVISPLEAVKETNEFKKAPVSNQVVYTKKAGKTV